MNTSTPTRHEAEASCVRARAFSGTTALSLLHVGGTASALAWGAGATPDGVFESAFLTTLLILREAPHHLRFEAIGIAA
jgi:hypothetical protein